MIARIGLAAISLLWIHHAAAAAAWESTVTASSPPSFPNPRPMNARYGFRWSGFPCAAAEIRLRKAGGDRLQLDVTARTTGLARALWKFDANHVSIVEGWTLHPISVRQMEIERGQRVLTEHTSNSTGVVSKV